MPPSGPRVSRAEIVLLAALAVWAAFPIVLVLVHASQTHSTFTGADGLIGANGVLGADQLQYLAWARDAGTHGLASDLFTLQPNGHVYLEPLFTITGALWRIGLSIQLAYLIWKPLAVVALLFAAVAWARRAFGDQLGARAAAVVLAVFLYTPLTALFSWFKLGGGSFRFELYLLGSELLAANKLWGYVPSALALALVPAALLAVERALDPNGHPPRRLDAPYGSRRPLSPFLGTGRAPPGRVAVAGEPVAGGRGARVAVRILASPLAGDHADRDLRRTRAVAQARRGARARGARSRRRAAARLLLPAQPHRPRVEARLELGGDLASAGSRAARRLRPARADRGFWRTAAGRDRVRAARAALDRRLLCDLLRQPRVRAARAAGSELSVRRARRARLAAPPAPGRARGRRGRPGDGPGPRI